MTPAVYSQWNKIKNVKISDDGDWAMYQISKEVGDKVLKIYDTRNKKEFTFDRVKKASFDQEGNFALFTIEHSYEDVRALKREKTKKNKMPKDTLCIYDLQNEVLVKIPRVKSFKTPIGWGGHVAFLLEPAETHDSLLLPLKESKENGSKLIVYNLSSQHSDTLFYAKDYIFSEKGQGLVGVSLGADPKIKKGLYSFDFQTSSWNPIIESKGEITNINWDEMGNQLAFIMNSDTTDNRRVPYELYYWDKENSISIQLANQNSKFLPDGYNISNFRKPSFSKNGQRLLFYMAPPSILQDTTLLEDEIVNVEVWHHDDLVLYTEQEIDLKNDKRRDHICIYDIKEKHIQAVGNELLDRVLLDDGKNSSYAIGIHTKSYDKERMWKGHGYFDAYRIDISTGEQVQFASQQRGRISISSNGKFCFWYDASIQGHWAYDIEGNKANQITSKEISRFGDEKNDRPMDPRSYGNAGFTTDDEFFIIYDRYDIWLVDPMNRVDPKCITQGRSSKMVHRIIDLDIENKTTDLTKPLLVHVFDEKDKSESYISIDVSAGKTIKLFSGEVRLDRTPLKAKDTEDVITTIEDYSTFPDLVLSTTSFEKMHTFSDVNPQQKEYSWGTIKLVDWTSQTGKKLEGLLVLPENFDPTKKYPLIVNFYERSSDRLNRHRAPYAHRSTINYSYYSSKGYVIFNPDVEYRIGYPGQSCYESVMPGIQALIDEGFINESKIGVQGHSWGGYQIADLLTKTDLFICAEAGAPVVNMVSAYGGIRWGSGMSRMFQYEKTQSRLGATLWERPDLYLENSPIFKLDKVTTPVLILHNDGDGAVPWYQGIEYFNALRRLGKSAWFLNYNDEPHWPVKWQNRLDFNKRMEQFFDHYLMDAPMPRWMEEGVPALKKGIDQGLDFRK